MRVENSKIKLTIPIPINRPDNNGVTYTKEAIEKATNNLCTNLPVIYKDNECDEKVIGTTTALSPVAWDPENQVCNMTIDGILFYSGAELVINEIKDGKVTDFDIVGIGLTK